MTAGCKIPRADSEFQPMHADGIINKFNFSFRNARTDGKHNFKYDMISSFLFLSVSFPCSVKYVLDYYSTIASDPPPLSICKMKIWY